MGASLGSDSNADESGGLEESGCSCLTTYVVLVNPQLFFVFSDTFRTRLMLYFLYGEGCVEAATEAGAGGVETLAEAFALSWASISAFL